MTERYQTAKEGGISNCGIITEYSGAHRDQDIKKAPVNES